MSICHVEPKCAGFASCQSNEASERVTASNILLEFPVFLDQNRYASVTLTNLRSPWVWVVHVATGCHWEKNTQLRREISYPRLSSTIGFEPPPPRDTRTILKISETRPQATVSRWNFFTQSPPESTSHNGTRTNADMRRKNLMIRICE